MKILTTAEIIQIVENCTTDDATNTYCEAYCPLFKECYYYYTGEKCGSALEQED